MPVEACASAPAYAAGDEKAGDFLLALFDIPVCILGAGGQRVQSVFHDTGVCRLLEQRGLILEKLNVCRVPHAMPAMPAMPH